MYLTGIIIALSTFLIIGIFHPIVVKTEYYFGTRPWPLFLALGIAPLPLPSASPTSYGRPCSASSAHRSFGASVNCSSKRSG